LMPNNASMPLQVIRAKVRDVGTTWMKDYRQSRKAL